MCTDILSKLAVELKAEVNVQFERFDFDRNRSLIADGL